MFTKLRLLAIVINDSKCSDTFVFKRLFDLDLDFPCTYRSVYCSFFYVYWGVYYFYIFFVRVAYALYPLFKVLCQGSALFQPKTDEKSFVSFDSVFIIVPKKSRKRRFHAFVNHVKLVARKSFAFCRPFSEQWTFYGLFEVAIRGQWIDSKKVNIHTSIT